MNAHHRCEVLQEFELSLGEMRPSGGQSDFKYLRSWCSTHVENLECVIIMRRRAIVEFEYLVVWLDVEDQWRDHTHCLLTRNSALSKWR